MDEKESSVSDIVERLTDAANDIECQDGMAVMLDAKDQIESLRQRVAELEAQNQAMKVSEATAWHHNDKLEAELSASQQRKVLNRVAELEIEAANTNHTMNEYRRELAAIKKQEPVAWFDPDSGLPYGWTEQPPTDNAVYLYLHAAPIPESTIEHCLTCDNRGRVNGESQETFCEQCIFQRTWRKDHYKPAAPKPQGWNHIPVEPDYL